jgi:acyl dehydratase
VTVDFHSLRRGDTLPGSRFTASAADVATYLAATGEPEGRWGELVPPLALGAWTIAAVLEQLPLPPGAVHAAQEFTFLAPVAVGTTLDVTLEVAQQSVRQGTHLLVIAAELRAGHPVLAGRATIAAPAL